MENFQRKFARQKEEPWFKVEKQFFDTYVKIVGVTPALTYLFIKRYEFMNEGEAWPSQDFIAENLGTCRKTIVGAIKILKAHNFFYITRERKGGHWSHNKYHLTESHEWLRVPDSHRTNQERNVPQPSENNSTDRVTNSVTNKNNYKKNKEEAPLKEMEDKKLKFSDFKPDFLKELDQLKEKVTKESI